MGRQYSWPFSTACSVDRLVGIAARVGALDHDVGRRAATAVDAVTVGAEQRHSAVVVLRLLVGEQHRAALDGLLLEGLGLRRRGTAPTGSSRPSRRGRSPTRSATPPSTRSRCAPSSTSSSKNGVRFSGWRGSGLRRRLTTRYTMKPSSAAMAATLMRIRTVRKLMPLGPAVERDASLRRRYLRRGRSARCRRLRSAHRAPLRGSARWCWSRSAGRSR